MCGRETGKSITFCQEYKDIAIFQRLLQQPIQFPRPHMPHSFIGRQAEVIKRNKQLLIISGYKRKIHSTRQGGCFLSASPNPLTYPNNPPYCHLFRIEFIIFAALCTIHPRPAEADNIACRNRHWTSARQTPVSDVTNTRL